ncbi:MAG: hypothetical protein DPW09_17800 [Anaerolineae bacterium]|nr:hypothetical protein [Anaerolineales bacterium]MCQ3975300.1 hypothetical protein [Anaerolineae bacterium]
MNGYNFTFSLIILGIIGGLIYAASVGSLAALATLAIVLTILLIAMGAGIALVAVKLMAEKEQKAFMDNAHENLTIMQALQTIQNQQNEQLLRQAKQLTGAMIPPVTAPAQALMIEDGIFEELDK